MDRTNRRLVALLAAAPVLALAAWLAFGFFGIQAAFLDETVDEAAPIFAATEAEQDAMAATDEFQDAMAASESASVDETVEDVMPAETPTIETLASGSFSGTSRYVIAGEAMVLGDGSEQRFLRFEDFEASNGPDLKVYLRAADGRYVSLGDLKGNIGSQNYEIPVDVDLATYSMVQIWCERFGVEFGGADLA